MKKLQNNFTTQEQSSKLLELGLPIDSADMFHNNSWGFVFALKQGEKIKWEEEHNKHLSPCWSVGRLIEIYCIVNNIEYCEINKSDIIENLIFALETSIKLNKADLSKLEE